MVSLREWHEKACLLSVGKLTAGHGIGGRNQQFALACARRIAETGQRVTVLSAGSDGIDGNSGAAGAVSDETTLARAQALGLDVDLALGEFDSNRVFRELGDTIVTGPSGNNVRDLRMLLSCG
jgi:glycerate 2-kinase